MNVLVVVDMQAAFPSSCHVPTMQAVGDEIRAAMDRDELIIFLEYDHYGETIPEIKALTRGYDKAVVIPKCSDDGSCAITGYLKARDLMPDTFKVCGVNKGSCVSVTCSGLLYFYSTVKVMLLEHASNCSCTGCLDTGKNCAINCHTANDNRGCFNMMERMRNKPNFVLVQELVPA